MIREFDIWLHGFFWLVGLFGLFFLIVQLMQPEQRTTLTVCFTPADQCEDLIVDEINGAHKSILIQAYHLTNHKVIAALLTKHQQNVPITVILDKTAKKEANPLLNTNIPVYIDGKVRIAHNKVMIIDDATTITGSYNFTESAEHHNAENLLVIDNGALSQAYEDNFYDRLNNSKEIK